MKKQLTLKKKPKKTLVLKKKTIKKNPKAKYA